MMHTFLAHVLILTYFPLIQGDAECAKDTGGTCQFLGCDASRGSTYCGGLFNPHCFCNDGYCALKGRCVPEATHKGQATVTTTTRAPSGLCQRAWDSECYNEKRYFHCGKVIGGTTVCSASNASAACKWGYNLPCCPDLEDGSFSFEPKDSACQRACNKLGDKKNEYLDYCPGGKLSSDQDVQGCAAAKSSLQSSQKQKDKSFCSNTQILTCNWQFCELDTCQDGSFSWSSGLDGGVCRKACDLLGNPQNSPKDYCEANNQNSTLTGSLQQCPPAIASFKKSVAPWCAAETDLLGSTPTGRSKVVPSLEAPRRRLSQEITSSIRMDETSNAQDSLCARAFAQQCIKQAPFSECCIPESGKTYVNCTWTFEAEGKRFGTGMNGWQETPDMYPSITEEVACKNLTLCNWLSDEENRIPNDYCFATGDPEKTKCFKYWGIGEASWCQGSEFASSSDGLKSTGFTVWAVAAAFLIAAVASLAAKVKSSLRPADNRRERLLGP